MHGPDLLYLILDPWPLGKLHEASRFHHAARRRGGNVAAPSARAATGGAAMTKRGRETTKLKGRNALPVARHRGPTAADLQKQLDQRTRELADAQKHLAEALEQQTA